MLTIITGTNRHGNQTQIIVDWYFNYLNAKGVECQNLKLTELPENYLLNEMYGKRSEPHQLLVDKYITGADKFVFVVPEYNGSYPGVMKLFIDSIHPMSFRGKKASLIGVADGRAGNILGMDHLTAVLNHIGLTTLPLRLPVSRIGDLTKNGELVNEETKRSLENQADAFIKF